MFVLTFFLSPPPPTPSLKTVIHTLRPHVSPDVAIQLKRSEFINQKVENNLADDVLKLTSGDIRFKPVS